MANNDSDNRVMGVLEQSNCSCELTQPFEVLKCPNHDKNKDYVAELVKDLIKSNKKEYKYKQINNTWNH